MHGVWRRVTKFFLRNFQSAEVISHRTHRTHSNDRFRTNIRGCSGLRCTNKTDGIQLPDWCTICSVGALETSAPPQIGALLGWCTSCSASGKAERRQVHPLELLHFLLRWCTPCSGKRQSRAETSAPLKYHRKTTDISEIIRNFAASVVESKLLDFCNTEAS